jgi:hypothetical protein
MLDTKVALSSTCDALNRLIDGYIDYSTRNDKPDFDKVGMNINEYEDTVYHQLLEHARELRWLLQQTDGLRQKLLGTSHLVREASNHLRGANSDTPIGFKLYGARKWTGPGRSRQRSTGGKFSNP